MTKELIHEQDLIDSFIKILDQPENSALPASKNYATGKVGSLPAPSHIESRLPAIFNLPLGTDDKYKKLFEGDISAYKGDQSSADLALCGYFVRQGLTTTEADQIFRVSALFRDKWDELRGTKTYGELTLAKAFGYTQAPTQGGTVNPQGTTGIKFNFLSKNHYKPVFVPNGMPTRRFIGPSISNGLRLFPANALSSLVGLGAMGKTSLLLTIACHVAAGRDWNNRPLEQQKVVMLFCEEEKQELNRKFSAITSDWTQTERQSCQENLLLIPLLGIDSRLTIIDKGQYRGSSIAEDLIKLLRAFGLINGLVILDHMQGFASGDLNISETATSICREANKIVEATGAAVVMTAHISKNNIKATEIEQGFAVGSLAFENATRQMSGLIPMSDVQAEKLGLKETKKEYAWLGIAKNSYGGSSEGLWLRKVISPHYHTVVMQPVILTAPVAPERLSEFAKISKRLIDYIARHPNSTRNTMDGLSGKDGEFKASKAKVRDCLKALIDSGEVEVTPVTNQMRKGHSIPKQVKEILCINKALSANRIESY
jgi:hypothetical protein